MHQIHAAPTASGSQPAQPAQSLPRTLEVEDLTVLTGWAQAVAEVLAYAPDRVSGVLAEACPGAPWRAALKIAEPSPQLSEAIDVIAQIVQAGMTLDALIAATSEEATGETKLAGLVRRVLRSTLEQRQSRQSREHHGI